MDRSRNENVVRHLAFVAANVRAWRVRLGMTQEQLAEAAGLDTRFVQRIERAQTNLSVSALVMLADALVVRPAELLQVAVLIPSTPGRPRRMAQPEPMKREGTHDASAGPVSTARPKRFAE